LRKTFLPKRKKEQRKQQQKTQKLQSPNMTWRRTTTTGTKPGEKQISIRSNQGDKTKAPLAQKLGGRQNKNKTN